MIDASELRLSVLEEENAQLRERVAYLETCLLGETSYAFLGLTVIESRIFAALMSREQLTKEQILTIAYFDKIDDLPEIKIIDVFICKIRKKIGPLGFEITTLWGRGYAIQPEIKHRVKDLVASMNGGDRLRGAA